MGGKADRFPLAAGSKRAAGPGDSIDEEIPLLLDPCRLSDTQLLWFDEIGQISVNPIVAGTNETATLRVEKSREIYHLDHSLIVRERRRVHQNVVGLIRDADATLRRLQVDEDATVRRAYEALLLQLRRLAHRDSEYSAVARCALRGYYKNSVAAETVLSSL